MCSASNPYYVPIDHIEFSVLRNKDIKNMSVIKNEPNEPFGITKTEMTHDGHNTLLDPRLGTTDTNMHCEKCGLEPTVCPGHYGHTDLAQPMYNYPYASIVSIIFSVICIRCGKLLIDKKNENEVKALLNSNIPKKLIIFKLRKILSSVKRCNRIDVECNAPVPKFKRESVKTKPEFKIIAEYIDEKGNEDEGKIGVDIKGKPKKRIDIIDGKKAYNILRIISDEDFAMMGFDPTKSRPEDFIMKTLVIPPLAIRPSVKTSTTSSTNYEDTLTVKLLEIINTNNKIRKELDNQHGSEESINLQFSTTLLQYSIITFYDNETLSMPKSEQKSSGKPIKSISERIKGKFGLIRGAMMGKRVNFSARTVITSDPNISLDELGVPIRIAMLVTIPEKVTPYNIEELSVLVKNGTEIYPGANYVIPRQQKSMNKWGWNLKFRKNIKIKPGDIVLRHMLNGDPTLFNRQPSLHKLSMQCHYANIINDDSLNTFRLNVSATTPYNAD